MGTSNLYKGPKGSSLLPADYSGEPDEQPNNEDQAPQEENPEQEESQQEEKPRVTWTQAKRTFSNQIGKRSPNVRLVAKTYTKASGGYKHAAKTSGSSKRVARGIINFFSGTPESIPALKRYLMTSILISAQEHRLARMLWQTRPCLRLSLSCLRVS